MFSNESLLQLISDAQMSTEAYRSVTVTKEKIIEDLKDTIDELRKLYNRVNGQSLILADYSKVANAIKDIDNWKGQAFQSDDEVDIALQVIAQEIDFPRNGTQKRITNADLDMATEMRSRADMAKKKYRLYFFIEDNYNDANDAIECGGNREIVSFVLPFLTLEMLTDKIKGNAVNDAIAISNNALDEFGHLEDVVYFITDEDEKNVLFYQDICGNWFSTETPDPKEPSEDKVEQVTIPVTIFVTATGTNISVKEAEIRSAMVATIEHYLSESDGDKFDEECAELDINVVETKVICSEPFTHTDIS